MINWLLRALELLLLIATLTLAVLWIRQPAGNFEPYTIVCGVMIAVVEIIRRNRKPDGGKSGALSTKKTKPVQPSAVELLDLIHQEPDQSKKGVVEVCKELEPENLYFFPKLQYNGAPIAMKARDFRGAIEALVERNWLFPAEYNESTDTITYEYRS